MGLDPLPHEQLHRVIGPPLRHSAPEVLAERGRDTAEDLDEFLDRFRTAIHEVEVTEALAYEGVEDVLHRVAAADRRLAVVTSKPMQATSRILPALGIADLFVHVEAPDQASTEVKVETMARAVEALALGTDDAVLVGDRRHDVEAGAAHGIPTIGVTWGGLGHRAELEDAGAALIVDTPGQLAEALGV